MKKRLIVSLAAIVTTFLTLSHAAAGDLTVTRYFSGLWDQTHQESQGIVLQVIDQEEAGNPKAVAYWFTYGDDLATAWYMGIGHVEGDQVLMELYSSGGVAFMEEDQVEVNPVETIGTLSLTFKNCNKGSAAYTMGEDFGTFDISRLAGLYNGRCTGGISDNTPSNAKPLMLEVALLPPGEGMEGKGKARFWQRADRSDFHVSAEDLVDGDYEIHVCGMNEGVLSILEGEGATHFRSPETEGKLLLDFVPTGCLIEVRQAGAVFLTSGDAVLAEKEKGPKDKADKLKIQVEMENTGAAGFELAEGELEYEVKVNQTEFDVEIKGVMAGSYGFFVGGTQYGTIEVLEDGEKSKLKFSDSGDEDKELLTFEPWDQIIEVRDDGNEAILLAAFPSAP